ncbi:hypothetical protein EYF80_020941 [Liparis tanakae]|uniref:Secreted protein n=1 Tax=Liparis tanakae TaxID=230148 RepID=A0A4Z2HSR8_9TELE|nr:hypothetical protein EYF80_020941 [Liparis tanakae]
MVCFKHPAILCLHLILTLDFWWSKRSQSGAECSSSTSRLGRGQQWARHPGTITLRAAKPVLVSCLNVASNASQRVPWVPPHLCSHGRGTEFSFITSMLITSADQK